MNLTIPGQMNTTDILIIGLVVLAGIALLVFMNVKNKKDRKKLINPQSTDPVEEQKTEQEIKRDIS